MKRTQRLGVDRGTEGQRRNRRRPHIDLEADGLKGRLLASTSRVWKTVNHGTKDEKLSNIEKMKTWKN